MILRPVDKKGLMFWFVASLVLIFISFFGFDFDWVISTIIGINLATMMAMFVDKTQATFGSRRLSERSLYIMTFCGGSIGMLLSIWFFRHKSKKMEFQLVVGLLIFLQAVFLFWWFGF
jgi:uncharacterized membrane protein YsdA (DUF1294 family)